MVRAGWIAVAVAAAVAVGAGIFIRQSQAPAAVEPGASRALSTAPLRELSGAPASIALWKGKVVVVNFWATWCPPCREETPALVRAQAKLASNGVQIIGVALDSADQVQGFAAEFAVNYPLLLGGTEMVQLMSSLGNRTGGLPFTVILDREGKFRASHLGALSEDQVEKLVRPIAEGR